MRGLMRYGEDELADNIATRFLSNVKKTYKEHGKLMEKYIVKGEGAAGGGEYPLQDGFGWTNAVTLALLSRQLE